MSDLNQTDSKRTFHYNACAHAISGSLVRPVQHDIEVQAPVSLPTTGGHGSSRVENFRVREFIHVKAAYSHVSGSEQRDGNKIFHTTLSTATVEGLNILDVITADRVICRVSSFWTDPGPKPGPNASADSKEAYAVDCHSHFSFSGSRFENLKIAGHEVKPKLNSKLVAELPTFRHVQKELAKNGDFFKMVQDPFQTGQPIDSPGKTGGFLCSISEDLTPLTCPTMKAHGHTIEIPHVGRVYLAEVLMDPFRRTLTMIRFELGSPVGGSGVAAESGVNGHPYPPPPPPPDDGK
jgi:hypothetical protein